MVPSRLIRAAILALGIALLAVGSGQAQAPQATVRITGPVNGATIDGPVEIGVEINGATVKHWNERDPTAVHHHLLIDVDPVTVVQAGVPLPPGQANIIHTIEPARQLMDLAPGPHTVTVVLTGTDHVPFSPSIQDQVSFTVRGSATATAAVGRGGALLADARLSLPAGLALVAVLLLGIGGLALRARRDA